MTKSAATVQFIDEVDDPGEELLDRVFFALSDPVRRAIPGGSARRRIAGLRSWRRRSTSRCRRCRATSRCLVRAGLMRQERTRAHQPLQPGGGAGVRGRGLDQPLQQILAGAVRLAGRHARGHRPSDSARKRRRPRSDAAALADRHGVADANSCARNVGGRADGKARGRFSEDEWIAAREQLLAKEKEFTRLRDQLSERRRALPWERVEKDYVFEGPKGKETLGAALRRQKPARGLPLHVRAGVRRRPARAARSGPTISTASSRI
mgnify:CR=1 FL=1